MATVTKDELATLQNTNGDTASTEETTYIGHFIGDLTGQATTAKELEKPYRLTLNGDVSGYADINASDTNLTVKVNEATHAAVADFAGKVDLASRSTLADLANLATYAIKSGKATETEHATKADTATTAETATQADKAKTADRATSAVNADNATNSVNAEYALIAEQARKDMDGNAIVDTYAKIADRVDTAVVSGKAVGLGSRDGNELKINITSLSSVLGEALVFSALPESGADTTKLYADLDKGCLWAYDATAQEWKNTILAAAQAKTLANNAVATANSATEISTAAKEASDNAVAEFTSKYKAATADDLGLVKPDAKTILITSEGVISCNSDNIYDNLSVNDANTHNMLWRGKDITANFDNGSFSAAVADGSFKDIFIGDYINKTVTISGKAYTCKFIVGHLDYFFKFPQIADGNNNITQWNNDTHHVLIFPEIPFFNAQMNSQHTTVGGYVGSAMYTSTLPAVQAGLSQVFTLVPFANYLTNSLDTNLTSGAGASRTGGAYESKWYTRYVELFSEKMTFGAPSWQTVNAYSTPEQIAAFRLNRQLLHIKDWWWWLRDIASSSEFCHCSSDGYSHPGVAAGSGGCRPFCLIK